MSAHPWTVDLPGYFSGTNCRAFAWAVWDSGDPPEWRGIRSLRLSDRSLTVTSFERESGLWTLHANHDVQRHGHRFVDRTFGVSLDIDAADGTLLKYSEKYAIPDVEAPPATPITQAQAYRVATGSSMPAGSAVEATLGYALPQGTTSGTAVLCWRLRFSKTRAGEATVIYDVDAKRATVIKRSVLN